MAVNTLICYIEDGVQKWNMANSKNRDDILLQLLTIDILPRLRLWLRGRGFF